ncbi:hypothetical protein PS425_09800 [Limosilactobacillus fermentum]|uniref:hypothetical protein n=1 Tax=Limosilactobacillus fermentum TaxID=1613 RepID=UPI001F38D10A|nr:hypothetical protein [Limosilactobacillus fermentum]UJP15631.1 hypothetical protein L1970_09660 [Limosilactobacillus fermentum]
MKKGLTIGIALITTLSLTACGNSQAKSDKAKKDSSSLVAKKKAHAKKESIKKANATSESKAKAESENKASSIAASSSSAVSVATSQSQAAQSSSVAKQQAASSSSQVSSSSAQSTGAITNSAQAVAAAEAKYGNNGGDWKWGCLYGNPQSGFFVKAISQSQLDCGSMTGTAQSVMVYGDGTIVSN